MKLRAPSTRGAICRATVFIVMLKIASVVAGGQQVRAHVSKQDVRKISAVVHAATQEPIISIDPIYAEHPISGSLVRKTAELQLSKEGRMSPITVYERTDSVSVRTGSPNSVKGAVYEVQRIDKTWKIVFKGNWMR